MNYTKHMTDFQIYLYHCKVRVGQTYKELFLSREYLNLKPGTEFSFKFYKIMREEMAPMLLYSL